MTPNRNGSAAIEFPNDLEIVITREFDAPIALVFDVLTKPEVAPRSKGAVPGGAELRARLQHPAHEPALCSSPLPKVIFLQRGSR